MLGKTWVKNVVTSQLETRGYTLKESAAPPRGFTAFLEVYRRQMRAPRTVFDIGVGHGTPWLYEAFPDADLILVEPLDVFRAEIETIMASRSARWDRCALGEADGEVEMRIPRRVPTSSSMLPPDPNWKELTAAARDTDVMSCTVPIRTLDEIAADADLPFVVKMDVEGVELKVLQGGPKTIFAADLIIAEASIAPRHAGGSDLVDIGAFLKPFGFRLAEIIEMSAYGPEKLLAYVDAAFVKVDSGFWDQARGREPGRSSSP